jgi:hypothetical protein
MILLSSIILTVIFLLLCIPAWHYAYKNHPTLNRWVPQGGITNEWQV